MRHSWPARLPIFLLLCAQPALVTATVTRYPYVQKLGRTSVTIMWRTTNQAAQTIEYGEGTSYDHSFTESQATSNHEVTLTGLFPGATYNYRLVGESLPGAPPFFFSTDHGRSTGTFSFFVTADIGENNATTGHQDETAAMILSQYPRPTFGLLAGDIVYPDGDAADYNANLMTPWRGVLGNMCVWPALGNHDWMRNPETNFVREWALPNNEHYYSFDYGNAHFIALDSKNGILHDKPAQLAWLRQDLEAHRGVQWTFVFFHHPMLTCTYKGHEPDLAQSLMPILDEFKVDVVFTGHAHTYERLYPIHNGAPIDMAMDPYYVKPRGVIYIVSGAGGKIEMNSPTVFCGINAFFLDERILFTMVHVLNDALIIFAIDSITGQVLDGISIMKESTTLDVASMAPRPSLLHNVPNPFNPSTTITFEIPVESLVNLDVYRADGRWITSLAHQVYGPGMHRVPWNGLDQRGELLPSGTYIARLKAGHVERTVKMTLLR